MGGEGVKAGIALVGIIRVEACLVGVAGNEGGIRGIGLVVVRIIRSADDCACVAGSSVAVRVYRRSTGRGAH
jgi:hypothetical protein